MGTWFYESSVSTPAESGRHKLAHPQRSSHETEDKPYKWLMWHRRTFRGANIIHNILTSLKQTMNTSIILISRFNTQMGNMVYVTTQYITGLTRFRIVQHKGLTMAQIRSSVLRMSGFCLISILSVSPCGVPSATSKLGVWFSVVTTC